MHQFPAPRAEPGPTAGLAGVHGCGVAVTGHQQGRPGLLRCLPSGARGQIERNGVGGHAGSMLALDRPQAVMVLQGDMQEGRTAVRTEGESMSQLPCGKDRGAGGGGGRPWGGTDDSSVSAPARHPLGPLGLCDGNGDLCPPGMLRKCQAVMRSPTASGALVKRVPPTGSHQLDVTRARHPGEVPGTCENTENAGDGPGSQQRRWGTHSFSGCLAGDGAGWGWQGTGNAMQPSLHLQERLHLKRIRDSRHRHQTPLSSRKDVTSLLGQVGHCLPPIHTFCLSRPLRP